jgi:hypothetical protein
VNTPASDPGESSFPICVLFRCCHCLAYPHFMVFLKNFFALLRFNDASVIFFVLFLAGFDAMSCFWLAWRSRPVCLFDTGSSLGLYAHRIIGLSPRDSPCALSSSLYWICHGILIPILDLTSIHPAPRMSPVFASMLFSRTTRHWLHVVWCTVCEQCESIHVTVRCLSASMTRATIVGVSIIDTKVPA